MALSKVFETKRIFRILSRQILGEPETPKMITFLIKRHVVKTELKALAILLLIIVFSTSTSLYLLWKTYYTSNIVTFTDGTQVTADEYIKGVKSGLYK
jgi:hypothetical protein